MFPRPTKWHVATISIIAGATLFLPRADAQTGKSKFKKGDRVEARDGFDWRPATVVNIDKDSGWLEVRLDKGEAGNGVSAEFRNHLGRRTLPPDSVRARREPHATAPAPQTPVRKWTDQSGKFSIDARYLSTTGDRAVLLKADGKKIEVPIAKLSNEDGRYLRELSNASESPFQEVAEDAPQAPGKTANWNGAKLIRPQTFKAWSFTPPTPKDHPQLSASIGDANIALTEIPDSQLFFEDIAGIYPARDGSRVVVCRKRGEVSLAKAVFLETVDVAKKQAGSLIPLPEETLVLDVDPEANLVMYRPAIFGAGQNGVLSLARIEGEKLVPVQQWEPYADESFPPSRDIELAWFLGENRVMTINGHGKALTIWDVKACQALINIPVAVSFNLQLALSPDRHLLAVIMKEGIALIDIVAGRHVATIPTSGQTYQKVAIRGDNTRLAGISDQGVTVWNLADGQTLSEFYSLSTWHDADLAWAGDYLVAGGHYLYDVERRILLWEYQDPPGSAGKAQLNNGRLYAVTKPIGESGKVVLISSAIPHAGAVEEAKTLPLAAELLVVKPGDSVSIVVDIDPSVSLDEAVKQSLNTKPELTGESNENEKIVVLNPKGTQNDIIRRLLTTSLTVAGLKVVEKSDLVVKAICRPQPQQVIRINVDGRLPPRPGDIQERTITPHASYLEMSLKGKVLWKRGFIAQPHVMIVMQRGESLDQALERLTKPNVALFTRAKFSPYVARPGTATPDGAYGVSQFTAHGLVDRKSSTGSAGAAFE